MISNDRRDTVLSDPVWEIVKYIVESCHLESFPGLFDLLRLYHSNDNWKNALETCNGSRAWNVAASRSLGAVPPVIEDPARAEDTEGAVQDFVLLFGGGNCSCGVQLDDLPLTYVNGKAVWVCSNICKDDDASLSHVVVANSKDTIKWDKWRKAAQKAIKDPVPLSSKRMKAALKEWLEWSSWTWEDAQDCQPILDAFASVRLSGVPLSINGCRELACLVMEYFTELDGPNDPALDDLEQWDDVLGDDSENMVAVAGKGSEHIPPL
ncbi:hypothetical protein M408DRAFT_332970, partial [Serendipita vermifera MAFF 305830]